MQPRLIHLVQYNKEVSAVEEIKAAIGEVTGPIEKILISEQFHKRLNNESMANVTFKREDYIFMNPSYVADIKEDYKIVLK